MIFTTQMRERLKYIAVTAVAIGEVILRALGGEPSSPFLAMCFFLLGMRAEYLANGELDVDKVLQKLSELGWRKVT